MEAVATVLPSLHPALDWFVQDHHLLTPALDALKQGVETGQRPSQGLLQHLHDHMAEHFGLEETVLFPVVPFTPSVVLLLAEHDALWQAWHAMKHACDQAATNWPALTLHYYEFMNRHIHEENACLLPSCHRDMTLDRLSKLARDLETAQHRTVWMERPALPRQVHPLDGSVTEVERIRYQIQPDCRVEWVTLPKGQALKPHVSPHAQTIITLSGQVQVSTPGWNGCLSAVADLAAIHIDPVVLTGIDANLDSQLLIIKQPVVYPRLAVLD